MRIISDEAHISLRAKIGEKAPLVGFVVLGAGTAMIFLKPSWLWPSMILSSQPTALGSLILVGLVSSYPICRRLKKSPLSTSSTDSASEKSDA